MTGSLSLSLSSREVRGLGDSRGWALDFWRALVFCALFSVIFLPEFSRDGTLNSCSPLYAKALAGFRFIDLAILFLAACHVTALSCSRTKKVAFPRSLALPGLAFLGCVAMAIVYGASRGGENFFFDWRGLALGFCLYVVWSFWMQTPANLQFAIKVFAAYMAARIALLYLLYLAGYREALMGVSIPIFDGPALSCIVFAGLLAFRFQEGASPAVTRLLWCGLAAAAYLLVLLCFRRTYWGELAVGTVILLLLRKRHRIRTIIFLTATLLMAAGVMGNSFSSRLQSLDVTSTDSEFSAGNADHLLDLADAWDQVRQSPVLGIGLGTSYPTWHIRNWKPESVMVHNAALHVWLKYGLAGLLCYLWFHIALLVWLYRRAAAGNALISSTFAYLAAQFVMTLGFAPWPYSEVQLTTLMSFVLAAAVMSDRTIFKHQSGLHR